MGTISMSSALEDAKSLVKGEIACEMFALNLKSRYANNYVRIWRLGRPCRSEMGSNISRRRTLALCSLYG